jgi:hypothetical protein
MESISTAERFHIQDLPSHTLVVYSTGHLMPPFFASNDLQNMLMKSGDYVVGYPVQQICLIITAL